MNLQPHVSGLASSLPFGSLVEMLRDGQRNGALTFGFWRFLFADGRIVRVEGDASGIRRDAVEATVDCLGWSDAAFAWRATPGRPEGNLNLDPTALLLEAARRMDEGQ